MKYHHLHSLTGNGKLYRCYVTSVRTYSKSLKTAEGWISEGVGIIDRNPEDFEFVESGSFAANMVQESVGQQVSYTYPEPVFGVKRVLILGGTSKLGRALTESFSCGSTKFEVISRSLSTDLDCRNLNQVSNLMRTLKPQVVINCVALSGLDTCEQEPDRALQLNTLLPKQLAILSNELGFKLIHFSTDAVFSGRRTKGYYTESDEVAPINVYGVTKFGGECMIKTYANDFQIFRLSLLVGGSGRVPQLVEKLIERAKNKEDLKLSIDVICSPSYTKDIANAVRDSIITDGLSPGVYHLANSGSVSIYELLQFIIKEMKLNCEIESCSQSTFKSLAPKNFYTAIKSEKGFSLRPWRIAMGEYCNDQQ